MLRRPFANSSTHSFVAPHMNAINVISPYKHYGMWVFDDPRVGLNQEPFVAGADTWIDLSLPTSPTPSAALRWSFLPRRSPAISTSSIGGGRRWRKLVLLGAAGHRRLSVSGAISIFLCGTETTLRADQTSELTVTGDQIKLEASHVTYRSWKWHCSAQDTLPPAGFVRPRSK